jgi:hypothetical protein
MTWKFRDFSKLTTNLVDEAWTVFKDATGSPTNKRYLKLETLATHSGKIINDRVYPGVHVKNGVKSFYKNVEGSAYNKPFLKNHDRDGEPIGRVVDAQYKQIASGKRFLKDYMDPTKEGSGFTKLTSHIMDTDAIEKFLDGRYETVSVSGGTEGAFCNICTKSKKDLHPIWTKLSDEEHCEHIPGRKYKDSECYIITGPLTYREVSQVNVPADDMAVHVAKELITQDCEDGSDNLFDFYKENESDPLFLPSPAAFSIVDSEGHVINGLSEDTYKSTKTISIADSNSSKKESEDTRDPSKMSDEEFAKVHILKHFSDLGMTEMSEAQKEEVALLKDSELSESQSRILKEPFIIHPSIPFKINDKAHFDAFVQMLDSGALKVDRVRFMDAMRKQAVLEKLSLDSEDTKMEKEALVKALADAQKKVEELEASVSAKTSTVSDLETKLKDSESKVKSLSDSLHKDRVMKIIDLRTELGYHDTKDLLDAAKKEATLKSLTEKYTAKDSSVIADMLEDLLAQKSSGGFVAKVAAHQTVQNPLEDSATKKADVKTSVEDTKTENKTLEISPW